MIISLLILGGHRAMTKKTKAQITDEKPATFFVVRVNKLRVKLDVASSTRLKRGFIKSLKKASLLLLSVSDLSHASLQSSVPRRRSSDDS